jgi:hypothetical protein
MNKILSAFVAFVLSFLLAACGGGSDVPVADQAASAASASVTANAVTDVTVLTVASTPEVSVLPGTQDVEIYSFRLDCPGNTCKPLRALRFTNPSGPIGQTIKSLQLVGANGNDVSLEAPYYWYVDQSTNAVVVQFAQNPWIVYHSINESNKVFFLKGEIATSAQKGEVIQLVLDGVDGDGFGMTVMPGTAGSKVSVIPVAGQNLPVVTNSSLSVLHGLSLGKDTLIGVYQVTCPAENSYGCLHTGISLDVYGADNVSVQSQSGYIQQQVAISGNTVSVAMFDYIAPGATQVYAIYGQPSVADVTLYMKKSSFSVNGYQTLVSPIVPATQEDCQFLVHEDRNCKG